MKDSAGCESRPSMLEGSIARRGPSCFGIVIPKRGSARNLLGCGGSRFLA